MKDEELKESFIRLKNVVAKLRDPVGGCPWDLEQTHQSLKPYAIEEAYEVIDAIENNPTKLPDELGDLLLQVMIHSQIGADNSTFDIKDVIDKVTDKMIRRHPHVFGDVTVSGARDVVQNWEKIKRGESKGSESVMTSIPKSLPALLKAQTVGEKASRLGFDWQDTSEVKEKINEELREFLESKNDTESKEEFGDLLFVLVQFGRLMKYNSEEILNTACNKFIRRFNRLEEKIGGDFRSRTLTELDQAWNEVKKEVG